MSKIRKIIHFFILLSVVCSYIFHNSYHHNKNNIHHNKTKTSHNVKLFNDNNSNVETKNLQNDPQKWIDGFYKNKYGEYKAQDKRVNLYVKNEENNDVYVDNYANHNVQNSQIVSGGNSSYINGNNLSNSYAGVSILYMPKIDLVIGGAEYDAYEKTNHSSSKLTEKDIILAYNAALKLSTNNYASFYIDIKSNDNIVLNVEYKDSTNKIVDKPIASYIDGSYDPSSNDWKIELIGVSVGIAGTVLFAVGGTIIGTLVLGAATDIRNYFRGGESLFGDFTQRIGFARDRNIITGNVFNNRITVNNVRTVTNRIPYNEGEDAYEDGYQSDLDHDVFDEEINRDDGFYSDDDIDDHGYTGFQRTDPYHYHSDGGLSVDVTGIRFQQGNFGPIFNYYERSGFGRTIDGIMPDSNRRGVLNLRPRGLGQLTNPIVYQEFSEDGVLLDIRFLWR